jgi:hypothetical protein
MTQDELKAKFILRDDGVFVNRTNGRAVGNTDKDGYTTIAFNVRGKTKTHKAHRLVWLWYFGEMPAGQLDHINRVKDDNRIENLRLASAEQNMSNRQKMRNNTTGYKGVFRTGKKFHGAVQANKKRHWIAPQDTAEQAFVKLQQLRIELHGEYACSEENE